MVQLMYRLKINEQAYVKCDDPIDAELIPSIVRSLSPVGQRRRRSQDTIHGHDQGREETQRS